MNIIHTKCSRTALFIDTLMTAMGWFGFFYLATKGTIAIAHGNLYSTGTTVPNNTTPTLYILLIYLTVIAFNAMVLALWAAYHKQPIAQQAKLSPSKLDDQVLASHFSLSCNQLHEVQDSRITHIYHTEDGKIIRLDTDQLRIASEINAKQFRRLA